MLLVLAACTCPNFADMQVRDPDGVGTPDLLDTVREAIATFAADTGRDGVCVPEVSVRDGVVVRREEVDGVYQGPHAPILLDGATGDAFDSVTHELCHAIDRVEGHVDSRPDLFPAERVALSVHYANDAERRNEAFARACAGGAFMSELWAAVDDACGGDPYLAPGERYVQEEIYAAVPRSPVAHGDIDMRMDTRTIQLSPGTQFYGMSGVRGELWLVVRRPVADEVWSIEIQRRAWPSGADRGVIPLAAGESRQPVFVRGDGGPMVVLGTRGDWRLLTIEPDAGVVRQVGSFADVGSYRTWSDGVLYTAEIAWDEATGERADRVTAWEDGVATEIVVPGGINGIGPAPGGFEASLYTGFARYDRATDTWTTWPTAWMEGFVRWSDTLRLHLAFVGGGGRSFAPVFLDVETGGFVLPAEPCATPMATKSMYGWTEVGDAVLAQLDYDTDTGVLELGVFRR